jgi:hypothetical protein
MPAANRRLYAARDRHATVGRLRERTTMGEEHHDGREAAMVWLKLVGLLVLVAAFGLLVFWLRRASVAR